MTTTAAGVQIATQLEEDLTTEFDQVLSVDRGDIVESPLEAQSSLSALVSLDQWKRLGQAGYLELEQHELFVLLSRKELDGNQDAIDGDQATAELVRRYLATWSHENMRVVDVLGPLSLDGSKLHKPGQSQILFSVDCDFLRNNRPEDDPQEELGEPDEDTPMMTTARLAAWQCIDNWPAFTVSSESIWGRKYQLDDDLAEIQLRDPDVSELPAIALAWGAVPLEWKTFREQTWPMALTATVWCHGHDYSFAERIVEELVKALYQAAPATNAPTYIHAALGTTPKQVGPISVESVDLGRSGNQRALKAQLQFVLRGTMDPFDD